MILPDVNILVYAMRADVPDHQLYFNWLEGIVNGSDLFGLSDIVLSGVIRIATHPKVFATPSTITEVMDFVEPLRRSSLCVSISAGNRHWEIFADLCRQTNAKGNDVPDAYLAALAIESQCEFITKDLGFKRFPGLTWRHPW